MNILVVESYINELLAPPTQPLSEEQRQAAGDYAAGLFVGRLDGLRAETDLDLQQLQGMHTLSHKQTFFVEYFMDDAGRDDARQLGIADTGLDDICRVLTNIDSIPTIIDGDVRKAIAERSHDWARAKVVAQLARPAGTDKNFLMPLQMTVNYAPAKLFAKATAIRAYQRFYAEALRRVESEPDQRLAEAKRALIGIHDGRLRAMAAVDVFPGLLSLEEQLTHLAEHERVNAWLAELRTVAPAIRRIHDLDGELGVRAREIYAKHLDIIRQGAPFELDDVQDREASIFSDQTLRDLVAAMQALSSPSVNQNGPTERAQALNGIVWNAKQIKTFIEAVLREWDMLSQYHVAWQEADDRDGFAEDGRFQVLVTPRRANLSVDSTRRIVNIPEDCERPLIGQYPAGVLPLVAHELSHVLQGYADYELGQQVPLARIKGRRYRILREAGGVYQEKVMERDYFGMTRNANNHYVKAYVAKAEGRSRVQVARIFYESVKGDQRLSSDEDEAMRAFAVNRTARLYRHGGQNSQVLDYVEQSIVCDILMQRMEPERVDAFLLGSASFSLEDSALLHRYGLLVLPTRAAWSPAHEVMRIFLEHFTP